MLRHMPLSPVNNLTDDIPPLHKGCMANTDITLPKAVFIYLDLHIFREKNREGVVGKGISPYTVLLKV